MKKVLIVAYYFPPSGGAGVQRTLKFAKYLPEFGWEPVILTVDESADFPARDPELMDELPDHINIYRSKIFEPYGLYRKLTGKHDQAVDIANLVQGEQPGLAQRLSEWVRATFFIPDARCFWRWTAVRKGLQIIRENNIDAIYSTAPPYTCHVIGEILHRKTGIPWVADFRDSWVGWLSAPERKGFSHKIDWNLEDQVLKQADRTITVTTGVKEDLLSRHKDVSQNKWHLISNGFDAADFEGMSGKPDPDKFILTYTGSLYGNRNPMALFEAVQNLLKTQPDLKDKLRLRFVGRMDQGYARAFESLGSMVEFISYVTHEQSIQYLLDSTALLLIIDDAPANKGIVTGKVYEYLSARRPILALAPEGEASQLIQSLNAGFIAPPHNVAAVQKTLETMLNDWAHGLLNAGMVHEEIQQFDRKVLTGELAKVLDKISQA